MGCNTAGRACEKGRQWEGALTLLQVMEHELLIPVVGCASEQGESWEEALPLLQEIVDRLLT